MITQVEFESFKACYTSAMYYDATYGCCANDEGQSHMVHSAEDFLSPAAKQRVHEDCIKFMQGDGVEAAIESVLIIAPSVRENYERPMYAVAGYLFWHNRNGSGVGFWDGDYPEAEGKLLDNLSKTFGECEIYEGDDEFVHILGVQ